MIALFYTQTQEDKDGNLIPDESIFVGVFSRKHLYMNRNEIEREIDKLVETNQITEGEFKRVKVIKNTVKLHQ